MVVAFTGYLLISLLPNNLSVYNPFKAIAFAQC